MSWRNRFRGATVISPDEPLAKRTTLRVGGSADLYVEPASEADLAAVLSFCRRLDRPFFVLGRGSNLLVKDGGFRGVVICLAQPHFSRIEAGGCRPAVRRRRQTQSGGGRSQTKQPGRLGIPGGNSRQRGRRACA